MKYKFNYSKEKDLILRVTRNISFEEIIDSINSSGLIADIEHFKRQNQRIFIVRVGNYVYSVPYVEDQKKGLFVFENSLS